MEFHVDRGEPTLPWLETMLLWSMRAWVIGSRRKIPVERQIEEVFDRIGAGDAVGALFGFMWVVGHGALRTLNVECVCNPGISADERCLLDVIALHQHRRSFEAMVLLRSLLAPRAALAAADSAARLTAALTDANRFLASPQLPTTRHVFTGPTPLPTWSATVH
jgi:hypothetical protein